MKDLKRIVILILAVTAALSVASCKGYNNGVGISAEGYLSIDKCRTYFDKGETYAFTATAENIADGVVWSSSDEAVVDITSDGFATAKSAGEAVITATAGKYSASVTVGINDDIVATIIINGYEHNIEVGGKFKPAVTLKYKGERVENLEFTFISDDETVAAVSSDGTITGVKKGKTVITVKSEYMLTTVYKQLVISVF